MAAPFSGGCPLSIAVIGVENMAESLGFYRGIIGMDVVGEATLRGLRFAGHWRTPPEARATAVLLRARGFDAGQVMLIDFADPRRERVRARRERHLLGLLNLNFHVADIASAHRDLSAKGYEAWGPPRQIRLSDGAGVETGALLEGPDGVIINLVQLDTTDETTRIGALRKFYLTKGATRTGYSPVMTSAHGIAARDKALPIYTDLLGLRIVVDETLGTANERTHWTFLEGRQPFGKIALGQALNYPVDDLTPFAVAPNVGYLAQAFEVPDLSDVALYCRDTHVEVYSPPDEIELPGIGRTLSMMARNPGSGALMQFFQLS